MWVSDNLRRVQHSHCATFSGFLGANLRAIECRKLSQGKGLKKRI